MTKDKVTQPKYMCITIRHVQQKRYDCIFCNKYKTEKKNDYYDIEICTEQQHVAKAVMLLLRSITKFEGNYDLETTININLCKFHYLNTLQKIIPLNKKTRINYDEFQQAVKQEKMETVQ